MSARFFSVLWPLSITCFYLTISPARAWNLNDVSVLFPLPQSTNENTLIKPSSRGSLGTLLPRIVFNKIGTLSNASEQSEQTYENLRAVSFRFDPCPAETNTQQACRPELRVIWQPLYSDSDPILNSEDAAIHTFYRLSPSQFQQIKSGLLKLKQGAETIGISTENIALNIHPALSSKKDGPRFQAELYRLLLSNIGEDNLYRFTFIKLLVPNNWWKFFSGLEKNPEGIWEQTRIPRHGGTEMDLINDSPTDTELDANIFTLLNYPKEDDLRYILSTGFRKTFLSSSPDRSDFPQFESGLKATFRFQNPIRTNPHTLDCAHCHSADIAQVFAYKTFPTLQETLLLDRDHFQNPEPEHFKLENETINSNSTKTVRAFGYFNRQVSIMTRTIHDSAASAHWLNSNE